MSKLKKVTPFKRIQTKFPQRTLSYQEVSTVLAALRYLQENRDDVISISMSHFDDVEPLTAEQIDTLCEEINTTSLILKGKY
jgi:hypothetical protein